MVTSNPSVPSSAVNIQIFSPQGNGGAQDSGACPTGQGVNAGPSNDTFQSNGQNSTAQPNPAATPEQQLQDAYNQAINARNNAEQARNSYMNMFTQMSSQQPAAQPQPQAAPTGPVPQAQAQAQPPGAQPAGGPPANFKRALPQMAGQGKTPTTTDAQGSIGYQTPPALPGRMPQTRTQARQPQQTIQTQQPAPAFQQAPVLPQASARQFNQVLASSGSRQEKENVMWEIARRGQAPPETYQLLEQTAMVDSNRLPPGQAQVEANYLRQSALWTLAMLNKAQGDTLPAGQLPGLRVIEDILYNRNEDPDIQAAAVQALGVMERGNQQPVTRILKKAAGNENPDVRQMARQILETGRKSAATVSPQSTLAAPA